MQLSRPHFEDPWQPMNLVSDYNQPTSAVSMNRNPVLLDLQDTRSDLVLFSFGICEKCTQHEETLKFLASGSNLAEGGGFDISLVPDHLGLHSVVMDKCVPHFPMDGETCLYDVGKDVSHYLMHPERQLVTPKPLLDLVGSHTSNITGHPDGRVLFTGSRAEMKDLLSIVAEFYPSKKWTNGTKQAMIVPYFSWSGGRRARGSNRVPSQMMQTQTATPHKSAEKGKLKKKQNRKGGKERDLYRKNYFHACECLLSAVLVKRRGGVSMLSLTKSAPEINDLLIQFSAGIAGTGLAVLFSVAFKVGSVRRPLSSAKLLTTGFGLGLFWLSGAVNGLRDTITHITKNSLKEDEMVSKVERSVNDVLFRAAALMAVAVLRFV